MDIVKIFADNVRKYRTKLGVSQEDFADMCGLHRTHISAVECCRCNVTIKNAQKIADTLGIDVYKLFLEEKPIK